MRYNTRRPIFHIQVDNSYIVPVGRWSTAIFNPNPISTSESIGLEGLSPDFVATSMSSLTEAIGPIAIVVIQRLIAQNPNISQLQLVDAMAKTIPDPQLAEAFLSRFLDEK